MFAAFDQNGNIRGIGTRLIVIGSDDIPFWEIQVRSNIVGENISFQYYSANDDEIYNVTD